MRKWMFAMLLLLIAAGPVSAYEKKGRVEGAIQEISKGKIVLREMETGSRNLMPVGYLLTPGTEYAGCRKNDLHKGDRVQLDYNFTAGHRTASRIELKV